MAWHTPTVVVDLPSPNGVGVMPATTTASRISYDEVYQDVFMRGYGERLDRFSCTEPATSTTRMLVTAPACVSLS